MAVVNQVSTNVLEEFNEERENPSQRNDSANPMLSKSCFPPSLSHGTINSTKISVQSPPPRDSLTEDTDFEIRVSSPDYSPNPNSIKLPDVIPLKPDEETCEHSIEEAIQTLFGEAEDQVEPEVIPPFFKEASINLVQITKSQ